jgi:flagellar protein FlaG
MAINAIPPVPQSSVPIPGTGSVERAPATPEPSSSPSGKSSAAIQGVSTPAIKGDQDLNSEVTKTIEALDLMMELRGRSVQFERDESVGKDVIKVVDDQTGEVIRQMPAEELLNFMRNLTKMLGNFLDERV